MIPGEYIYSDEEIVINSGKEVVSLVVTNTGDRPIQVGSHFHFFEVNRALKFDRHRAFGRRLNIPSGTAVRFEPGQSHSIELVPFGGIGALFGFNNLTDGSITDELNRDSALEKVKRFCDNK